MKERSKLTTHPAVQPGGVALANDPEPRSTALASEAGQCNQVYVTSGHQSVTNVLHSPLTSIVYSFMNFKIRTHVFYGYDENKHLNAHHPKKIKAGSNTVTNIWDETHTKSQ